MRKYTYLLVHDIRNAARNPMFILIGLGPLLLVAVMRYVLPHFASWLASYTGFDLYVYIDFISILTLLLIPQLIGIGVGLFMLDERDERLIDYYAVTPLRKQGYYMYRLFLPVLITLLVSLLYQAEHWPVLILLAVEAPIYALFLVAFAANKVEGLALSKLVGLLLIGAICAYFVPERWQWLAAPLPTYWPSRLYVSGFGHGQDFVLSSGAFVLGLIFHLYLLYKLFVRCFHRVE